MTPAAAVLGVSIAAPLLLLSEPGNTTTITLPALLPTAAGVVLVLTAFGLLTRFIFRPLRRSIGFVRDRLDELGGLVEQVRELVQYVGLFGGDVEARLDRIERALGLGYYRRDSDKPAPTVLPPPLVDRLRTQQAIRDLGDDDPT